MTSTPANTVNQERRLRIQPSFLLRGSGLSAMLAGFLFAAIQPIHPPDVVASVSTTAWAIITPLKTVMCMMFLIGLTGIYARQLRHTGPLALLGYAILSLGWMITTAYVFAETFILPPLAATAPDYVDAFLGVAANRKSSLDLGAVPALFAVAGVGYMLGGLLFGIATFRAGVFPRWAGALMAATAALTPLAAFLPHAIQRFAAVPMGVALIGLGYALWTGRSDRAGWPSES